MILKTTEKQNRVVPIKDELRYNEGIKRKGLSAENPTDKKLYRPQNLPYGIILRCLNFYYTPCPPTFKV